MAEVTSSAVAPPAVDVIETNPIRTWKCFWFCKDRIDKTGKRQLEENCDD